MTAIADVELEGEGYCKTCGSCGIEGCCSFSRCDKIRCDYGDAYIREMQRISDECVDFYDMLVALGIENPYQINLEDVERISDTIIPGFYSKTIKDCILAGFEQFREKEND